MDYASADIQTVDRNMVKDVLRGMYLRKREIAHDKLLSMQSYFTGSLATLNQSPSTCWT